MMNVFGVVYMYNNHAIIYTTWLFSICCVNIQIYNDYLSSKAILEQVMLFGNNVTD